MKLIFDFPDAYKKALEDSYAKQPSHCGTCYGAGHTELEVPVRDYQNGGYIDVRYEPCQECGGDR